MDDSTPLGEVRDRVRENAESGGAHCPACGQFTKVYKRSINGEMATTLILAWRKHQLDWFHLPTLLGRGSGDTAKLRYWGLLEHDPTPRDDGGQGGSWRVTNLGERFIHGRLLVDKYAHVFDSECLGFSGPKVSIADALGKKFNWQELMNA